MENVVPDKMFYCLEQLQQDNKEKTLIERTPLTQSPAVTLKIAIIFLHHKKQGTATTKLRPIRETYTSSAHCKRKQEIELMVTDPVVEQKHRNGEELSQHWDVGDTAGHIQP